MYMFIGWGIGEEEIRPAAQEMGNLSQKKRLLIISTANQVVDFKKYIIPSFSNKTAASFWFLRKAFPFYEAYGRS
jgi:hypothetical protein